MKSAVMGNKTDFPRPSHNYQMKAILRNVLDGIAAHSVTVSPQCYWVASVYSVVCLLYKW